MALMNSSFCGFSVAVLMCDLVSTPNDTHMCVVLVNVISKEELTTREEHLPRCLLSLNKEESTTR